MQNTPIPEPSDELKEIFRQLKLGMAHERVNDENVFTLIDLAQRNGEVELAQLLHEWQSPCSDGSEGVPSVAAPSRGFNREHVKR